MRILLIHAEEIWYRTHKPAIKNPPDPPSEHSSRNATVAYLSIERGDTEETVAEAANEIIKYARDMVKSTSIVLYPYAHLSSNLEKPSRAHKLLVMLEERLREVWRGDFHRAPFGWYQEFRLHSKSHPLSELSRTITPDKAKVRYKSIDGYLDIEEAASRGLIPQCLSGKSLGFKGLSKEKAELFGLANFESWISTGFISMLKKRIESMYTPIEYYRNKPFVDPGITYRIEEISNLYREGLESPINSLVGAPLASSVIKTGIDIYEIIEEINPDITSHLHEIRLCGGTNCLDIGVEGSLVLYEGNICVPLGIKLNDYVLLGPLGNIVRMAVDYESILAEKTDHTPKLPVWLHPITAYLIPVGDEVADYTRTIAIELAGIGANVIVDKSTKGVGARVRKAGKLWVPYIITIGKREMETGTVTIRRRAKPGTQEVLPFSELVSEVKSLLNVYGVSGSVRYLT